jgi:uncharacterized protein YutE (UPF0331/DUF86 family)
VVDVTVVQRKLSQLDTYLQQVSEFSTITLEEYQGEWKIQRIVERTLQMMIETCVDIANHLISDRGMRSPTSYADTFQILKENAIVNDSLHDSLENFDVSIAIPMIAKIPGSRRSAQTRDRLPAWYVGGF